MAYAKPMARDAKFGCSQIALLATDRLKEIDMGTCGCGFTTDPDKNCNGTHRVVQAVKADIAKKLSDNGFPEAAEFVKTEKKN